MLEEEELKMIKGKIKLILIIVSIIIVGIVILIIIDKEGKVEYSATSSIKELKRINELDAIQCLYTGVATKYNEKQEAEYHVKYKGIIRLGINFEDIDLNIDKKNKKIYLKIPEIKINNVELLDSKYDYIFNDSKYNKEGMGHEIEKICKADLEKNAKDNRNLNKMAKENIIEILKKLIYSSNDKIENVYEIVIE